MNTVTEISDDRNHLPRLLGPRDLFIDPAELLGQAVYEAVLRGHDLRPLFDRIERATRRAG